MKKPARRIATALILSALLAVSGGATPPSVRAATPLDAARAHLAATHGGSPAGWRLLYERSITALDGSPIWVGKLIDKRGALQIVYRAADGAIGGQEVLAGRNAKAMAKPSKLTAKADRALVGALASSAAGDTLPVAVWLSADPRAAVAAVIARHPEVEWRGDRPVVDDLATVRAIRGELDAARASTYGSVEAALRGRIKALGGRIGYASTNAPLLFVDLPAGRVAALAGEAGVTSLGLEEGWAPAMSAAGPTVDANWTSGTGDQGTGIRIAVVEYHNVRKTGDLAGRVVASHSTTGSLAYASGGVFDHPTWVAGAIAGQNSTYHGVAPGALIVSSGTGGYVPSLTADRAVVAAADWAMSASGGDADIINTSLVQDTATGAEEARRFFDAIAYQGGRLPVSAAGNFANGIGWQVGSPGTGYNVLTVGGVDDRGTASRGDDRIWYVPGSNGSNFLDPPGTAWNKHGDFNKPDIAAPAVGVRTANGLAASGTSVAAPIVAGIAAQVMARAPRLAAWPEAVRAIIMAGAVYRTPMPDGSINVDHGGAGSVSALWASRILGEGDGKYGGSTFATLKPGEEPIIEIAVKAGQRIRVALSWSSHTSGGMLGKTDQLTADLDLEITLPGGTTAGSYSLDNANEWVDFTSPTSGTARIQVLAGALRRQRRAIRAGVGQAAYHHQHAPAAIPALRAGPVDGLPQGDPDRVQAELDRRRAAQQGCDLRRADAGNQRRTGAGQGSRLPEGEQRAAGRILGARVGTRIRAGHDRQAHIHACATDQLCGGNLYRADLRLAGPRHRQADGEAGGRLRRLGIRPGDHQRASLFQGERRHLGRLLDSRQQAGGPRLDRSQRRIGGNVLDRRRHPS